MGVEEIEHVGESLNTTIVRAYCVCLPFKGTIHNNVMMGKVFTYSNEHNCESEK